MILPSAIARRSSRSQPRTVLSMSRTPYRLTLSTLSPTARVNASESPTSRNFTGWVVNALEAVSAWRSAIGITSLTLTRTAAVAGATVPATTTATVPTMSTMAGTAALSERQKVPYMTGRSTR